MTETGEDKYVIGPNGEKRLKGMQFALPVVTGTIAFSLGKKATETATHRWIVFLRSPFGIDLSHVIEKVTFELHNSFPDPVREVTQQPFELTEAGWGEFDIVVRLHFSKDTEEAPFELYHHLQLGLDAHGNPQKRPHLHEVFEEIVFWEPTEVFYNRVINHQPKAAPVSQLAQYFGKYDPSADYNRIQNARKRLAPATAHLKAQLAALEAEENGQAAMETG